MKESGRSEPSRWAIVLAGGDGERLKPFIQERFGCDKPKQYCKLTSDRTLLEETLLRVRALVSSERILTIIGHDHRRFLNGEAKLCPRFIEQPAKRETAPGIFLPAAHVLREDPSATILIFPSDHYISAGRVFEQRVAAAAESAEMWPDKLVLLGAVPDGPEEDYGWIEPVRSSSAVSSALRIRRFREKPSAPEAEELYSRGCLWNTMIMAVKVRTLWEIGRQCLPEMMRRFEAVVPALGGLQEADAVEAAYRGMDSYNFSRDIVEQVPDRVLVLPMSGVEWSDLGRPSRISHTLGRRGQQLSIPVLSASV